MLVLKPAGIMGKHRGDDEESSDRKAKKQKNKEVDSKDDETAGSDEEASRAARKGRKAALKATRRLARALGVKFKDGGSDDDNASDDDKPGAFDGFPSRKEVRKLSDSQREALVCVLRSRQSSVCFRLDRFFTRINAGVGFDVCTCRWTG